MNGKTDLTEDEELRYSRQLALSEIGLEGQKKLKAARVLIVGAGGLGSPAAMYLSAAGVGTLGIVDGDSVDLSNLQRQILHGDAELGKPKTESAAKALSRINPATDVRLYHATLTRENADALIRQYDMVLGCVDNFTARYAINETCVAQKKPNVFGSAAMFQGQASVFGKDGPCYQCFFRDPPPDDWHPSPREKGVLGTIPGIIGCIQANETIKLILGLDGVLSGRLLLFDGLAMTFREIALRKDPECPACGNGAE